MRCDILFKNVFSFLLQRVLGQSLEPLASLPELNVFVAELRLEEFFKELNPICNTSEAALTHTSEAALTHASTTGVIT